MISWVRERVATRWIQTRKRGSASTGQTTTITSTTTDDDDDEDEDTSSFNNENNIHNSFRDNDDYEEDDDEESGEDDNHYTYAPTSPSNRPHRRPQETLHRRNLSKPSTNRSIRAEKHNNSKLEM